MQLLRTNTATRVTVGPFLDKTDGVTPEVAITVTAEKLTFIVDTAGVPTLILDTAPTASGGANDMVHITGDDAGYYDLELAAADVNYLGRAKLALTDATVHCPVFHEYMIIPAMVYDALILGTDTLQSDTVQWLGTACSTPTTGGVPEVDVTHVAGTAQTAGDIIADTNDIQTQIGTAGAGLTALVDLVWDEVLTGATHNVTNSSGKRLRLLAAQVIISGTIPSQAGMAINAITLDAAASATSHLYVENLIVIDSGAAIGEAHHILSYNGTTKVAIIDDDWITQPVAGDTYQIFGSSAFDATTGLATAGSANTMTLEAAQSSAVTDYYINQSIYIPSGTGAGQRRRISAYNGTTKVATVSSNWATNPDATSAYMIYEGNQVFVDTYATNQAPAGVKKNSALNNFEFYMIDSSDDVSGKTGLTVTAERSIDGAAFGACANAVSEVANGLYKINLATTDLNGDVITLKFTATGANATVVTILTKA